ncbi:serine/threonine-protein kinase [Clostridium estertheticum]|uniref:serine/threonine-protein kinase n=1 Tax=Clostridium estertheticum TaxID=238834 RepID=UPI00124D557B|nr:serine/threonine-protein kinase [Clostridium estertheticum]MBZ9616788.1 serine/threonine protein kinase [Clostridium estertheticum subsp. laramiense]WAG72495.1 serine/threonine protein kinase [Clostridium estertheticum]
MALCSTVLKFDLRESIGGEGQNSTVYKAFDPQLNADLVVKKVAKQLIIDDYQSIDESNFYIESRILYECKHPNVMEIQYASEDEESIYFSMPFCKRGSLNSIINTRYLTVKEIVKYSLEFLLGLHYIHTKGLIHFDVKPTNILIDNNNKSIITDFGLAKYTDLYGFVRPNKIYSSHKPPEGFSNSGYTNKSDIYQAGLTIYRMCNGNDKYYEEYNLWKNKGQVEEAISKGKFPDRNYYLPHIPARLRKFINKAMNVDLDKRYDNILDMINDISSIDKNLEWEYNKDANTHSMVWSIYNEAKTHINRIELIDKGNNTSEIIGRKTRVKDSDTKNIIKWNIKSIESNKAFKQIETFMKEYK